MNKLEYIQGDLVMTKTEPNNFTPNGVICKFVRYEDKNKVLIDVVNGVDHYVSEREWIAPVPLTLGVLEKNEWICTNDFPLTYTKGNQPHTFRVAQFYAKKDVFYVYHGRDNYPLREVRYVHQLQHLLFGLGLNHEMEV